MTDRISPDTDPHQLAWIAVAGYDLHSPHRHLIVRRQDGTHLLVGFALLRGSSYMNLDGPIG